MASSSNDATAVANEPDTNNHNAADSSDLTDAVDNVAEAFTLFSLLPPELRFMVWEFAMAMEKPRLVHLHARGCDITRGHKRRGCPRGHGPRLNINDAQYEQVPPYFFVNHECRFFALKHYSIRFLVVQDFRAHPIFPADRRVTNIVMSPDDILVSWHTESLLKSRWAADYFRIRFGPEASLVRNLMVNPWRNTYDPPTFEMVSRLVGKLNNSKSIEKVYLLRNRGRGPLKYGGGNQQSIEENRINSTIRRVFSPKYRYRLETLIKDTRIEWLYVDAEPDTKSQVSDSNNPQTEG
ncbi:hypothetical protein F4782DRAFT_545524 [Xylaria castorea]|nr:hypothetical protein F4782DRAFT_545524 [Xylaria castorea]